MFYVLLLMLPSFAYLSSRLAGEGPGKELAGILKVSTDAESLSLLCSFCLLLLKHCVHHLLHRLAEKDPSRPRNDKNIIKVVRQGMV